MSSVVSPQPRSASPERDLLHAAQGGDEHAFRCLVAPHRPALHTHSYRMLGSFHDAEDALQEALLKAWRGLNHFEGRSSLVSWLYRITTNACLDAIERRHKRVLPMDYGRLAGGDVDQDESPLADSTWIEPYPDDRIGVEDGRATPEARYEQREAVELAFVAALQHLPGRQRAVLILRDVLGFSAKEAARTLDSTPASINSALQRARKAIEERLPEQSQQTTIRSLGDERLRDIAERFADAFERGEVDAIVSLLAEDATFSMPPFASVARGREAIVDSWLMPGGPPPRLRYVPARANGQLAFGTYQLDRAEGEYLPIALDVLALRGARVSEVIAFRTPQIFLRFGLPTKLGPYNPSESGVWRGSTERYR